jgi:hypothetical protein
MTLGHSRKAVRLLVVAAMFAEERPALLPLPVEPFRYYLYGQRTVHFHTMARPRAGSGDAFTCSGMPRMCAWSIRSTGIYRVFQRRFSAACIMNAGWKKGRVVPAPTFSHLQALIYNFS